MKNSFKISLVFFSFFMILVSGCTNLSKELADTGLFGEHSLGRIESFSAVTGSVSGSFFLGCGDVNGSIGSEFRLQFHWSPKPNVLVVTSLPYSKFRFMIDESKDIPTVEFVFPECWNRNCSGKIVQESKKLDLNYWINDGVVVAIVKISMATMEKEIYLPKFR